MKTEKSRLISGAAPQPESSINGISGNDFAAIVPVISGQIGGRDTSIVSARALHKTLGVGRDFTNWIKGRIEQYGFIAGTDFIRVENLSTPKRASAKSRQQLEHLTYLESTNTTLIDMGMGYDQRKAELMRLSQRWLSKRLGAAHD